MILLAVYATLAIALAFSMMMCMMEPVNAWVAAFMERKR